MKPDYVQLRIWRKTYNRLRAQAAKKTIKRKKRVTVLQHLDELSNPKRVPVRTVDGI